MRPTQAIIRQRVEELLAIRLDGAQFWDVWQYVAEKQAAGEVPWTIADGDKPISQRTLWRYIARTEKLIEESCRETRKKTFRRHTAQRRNLYAKAISQGDIRGALAAIDSEAKLLGLFAPTKTELTGKDGAPLGTTLTVEDLVQADRELEDFKNGRGEGGADEPDNTAPCPQLPA